MPEQCINMRVTANSNQGHRKYMEDCYKIRFQRENQESEESNILFSYFGIFDGHGGKEAAQYAKENLYWKIIESEDFWSEDENKILKSIHDGFIKCHTDMWKELPKWPKTPAGLPSTSGCTATVLFIKKSKAYVGHVGDSGLLLGFGGDSFHTQWTGKKLTRDHKPEDPIELKRIENSGGEVMTKGGVNRVVWNRPVSSHQGPVRRNTPLEKIPFLAVARSLGDLWSYNYDKDEFIVSPVPDVFAFDIDPNIHKCIVLATDGVWNILKSSEIVEIVRQTDKETENLVLKAHNKSEIQPFVNPSQRIVNLTIQRCCEKMLRADNTSCITIMIDKPGLSFSDNILQKQDQTLSESQQIDELCTPNSTRYLNTPSFHSKSLISLRRRHWSASTNNSETKSRHTKSVKSLHLNENLSNKLSLKKKLFNNSYSFGNEKHKKFYGNEDNMIKLSKKIKNLYENDQESQENQTFSNNKTENNGRTPVNSYKRRLRLIKNRLMKTKNSIFSKRRKMFHVKRLSTNNNQQQQQQQEANCNNNNDETNSAGNQTLKRNNSSFIDNFRHKFNTLKRNYDNNDERQPKKLKVN